MLGPGFCTDKDFTQGAEHGAVVPPLLPVQLQLHGPLPLTIEANPVLQRLVVGALLIATPFDEPHKSLMGGGRRWRWRMSLRRPETAGRGERCWNAE